MNKTELIALTAERTGMTRKDTERVINAALDAVCAAMSDGGKVQLSGFGTFDVKDREARVGRNPRTSEMVTIAATKVPVFKPSQALRDLVAKK